MRTLRACVFLCLAGLSSALPVGAQEREQRRAENPDREAVRAVVVGVSAAIQDRNWSALDTLFASGGVHIIAGAQISHGLQEHRTTYLEPTFSGLTEISYTFDRVEPQVRTTVAWVAFRYTLNALGSEGPVAREGRGTAVLEKSDGRWIIVHYQIS